MAFENVFSSFNISGSGATAERFWMEVVANNIANAFSTRSPGGGPFRRQNVVFEAVLDERLQAQGAAPVRARALSQPGGLRPGGVQVDDLVDDVSQLPQVFNPGHPDADSNGFVLMPNVQLPLELVNLIAANRAYEANLKVAQAFRQSVEQALPIARA
jgi:flagellar basal-body rod protein FlgC